MKDNSIVFGVWPVTEAFDSDKEFDKILIQRGLTNPQITEIKQLAKDRQIPVQTVPIERLNRVTRKNHQGVIGFISPIAFHDIETLMPSIYENGDIPLIMILDGLTDVRNFGAIVRTAECSGVNAVIIPSKGGAAVNGDALKTSAGALFNVPVAKVNNIHQTIRFLQQSGVQVVGCTEKTNDSMYDVDYTMPTAIVMGNEETGLSNDVLKTADRLAKIPMMGKTGSLNVSAASAIILYETVRQRLS